MADSAVHACASPTAATSDGIFQGDNPLDHALPLAILQICLVVFLTRSIAFILKPLRQPRVIAEIIGGILLGPSALGRSQSYLNVVFPKRSLTVLDTLANMGLLFFLFLVGVELDLKAIRKTGKQAFGIAAAGISLPFLLGIGTSLVFKNTVSKGVNWPPFLVFMGVALSITAFPVLARILAELKLLTTDVGRMAMSAAAVNDVVAWILLALAIALSSSEHSPLISLWVLLCGAAFVLCAFFILRPILLWMAHRCHDGEPIEEIFICATLATVLAAGLITDAIGIHALFGAFVVGIFIPKEGPFAGALVEKVEDLVSSLFLPLYFVSSGLKTDVTTIKGMQSWWMLGLVILTACVGKVAGTIIVTSACRIPLREAWTLGFLMNTKGLVELIVLNIGKDRKVLNDQTFSIMVLMALFTTFITTPIVVALYKPARRSSSSCKHRTIHRKDRDTDLRILACFHSTRNIPTMINLIEASRGSERRSKLCVYALHLMELSERPSAIRLVHKARKNGLPFWNNMPWSDSDQHVVAFEAFQQLSRVSIRPMTAISALSTIHEDICASAEMKKAAVVILPFHKHQRFDGAFESTRMELQSINRKVLEKAPCTVGILVDRGFGGTVQISAIDLSSSVVVLLLGGPDDYEVLAYGMRMAEHPGIHLTVIRFVPTSNHNGLETKGDESNAGDESCSSDPDGLLTYFQKMSTKENSLKYEERTVGSREEAMSVMGEFSHCNLILLGRGPYGDALRTTSIVNKGEYPELGPIGSLLVSPDFSTTASVLVMQRYPGEGTSRNSMDADPGNLESSLAADSDF